MNTEIQDRMERNSTIFKQIKLPSKESSITGKCVNASKLKYLDFALLYLNKIKQGIGDQVQNLIYLFGSLKNIFNSNNLSQLDTLCEQFPYNDFFILIANGPTPEICRLSLGIFSYCANSKNFPRNTFSQKDKIEFFFSLLCNPDLKESKQNKYLFNIFNQIILIRADIRNVLLKNGILNFAISKNLTPTSKSAVDFLATCLCVEPDIEQGYANTINAFLLFALKQENKRDYISTVLNIFIRRKNKLFNPIYNPKVIDPMLVKYILDDLPRMNIAPTFVPILKIASIVKLNDQNFISILTYFLEKVSDKQIISKYELTCCLKTMRCSMKIMINNYERWRAYPAIVQCILSILNTKEAKLPFVIEQSLVQVLMLYITIEPKMDLTALEHAFNFIDDRVIGTNCLAFLYQSFTIILNSEDSNENKAKVKNLFESNIEKIEEIAYENDEENENSHEIAISILNLLNTTQ